MLFVACNRCESQKWKKMEKTVGIRRLLHVINASHNRKIGSCFDNSLHAIDLESLGSVTCKGYRGFTLIYIQFYNFKKFKEYIGVCMRDLDYNSLLKKFEIFHSLMIYEP